ncbi:hypothetical protein B5X24_HaOG212363 [Helicoverpa armigera]|nr:hypothetical protein B5X24_HaOG212363 [Helicoverpa armigera]
MLFSTRVSPFIMEGNWALFIQEPRAISTGPWWKCLDWNGVETFGEAMGCGSSIDLTILDLRLIKRNA